MSASSKNIVKQADIELRNVYINMTESDRQIIDAYVEKLALSIDENSTKLDGFLSLLISTAVLRVVNDVIDTVAFEENFNPLD